MAADLATQVARTDLNGFTQTLEEIIAGESATAYGTFQFPAGFEVTGAAGAWSLLDNTGAVYAVGNAQDFQVDSDAFSTKVRLSGLISAPSQLPPSSATMSYQLRWELTLADGTRQFAFNSLRVLGLTSSPIGPVSTCELAGDRLTLNLITAAQASEVKLSLYGLNNAKLVPADFTAVDPVEVAGGFLYKVEIDPDNIGVNGNPLVAQLEPYIASWRVASANTYVIDRQTSELFIVNSSILSAVEDVRRMLMKARTTAFGFDDTLFNPLTILAGLRRGRDMFNAAAGHLTEFSMTNATGGIREFWLRYSEVAMLLAHALAEGEKAFNFAGQAISLDVDKAQAYQTLASELQQRLDQDVKPFKQNLIKKGAVSGDGNMAGVAMSAHSTSRVGLSIHPSSLVGRQWRYP